MNAACPHCQRVVQVPSEIADGSLRCSACGLTFSLPATGAAELNLRPEPIESTLPILDDSDEYEDPPEVGPVPRRGGQPPAAFYARGYRRFVAQLSADTTVSLLLLALHALTALVYGMGQASALATATLASNDGIAVDAVVRIWQPLALYEVMMVSAVAVVYWVSFLIAIRCLRMAISGSGFLASWAIASLPSTICLATAWFSGWPLQVIALQSVLAATPLVVLFTSAIFGLRLYKSLILGVICLLLAGPPFLLASRMYDLYAAAGTRADQRRIALQVAARDPSATESSELVPGLPENPRIRAMVETILASAGTTLPSVPASATLGPPATGPAVPGVVGPPRLSPGISLEPWDSAKPAHQVIWPTIPGDSFATLWTDALGNHTIKFWLARDLSKQSEMRIGGSPGSSYAISPSGKLLLRIMRAPLPIAELWDIGTARREAQILLAKGNGIPAAVGFLDNGSYSIAWRSRPRFTIDIHATNSGQLVRSIGWPDSGQRKASPAPEMVWLSPDGKAIAGIDAAFRLCVLDTASAQLRQQWQVDVASAQTATASAITFAPDGSHLAVILDTTSAQIASSVLLVADLRGGRLTAIPFGSPPWRLAGCPGPPVRNGGVISWVSDTHLLLYGELIVDTATGAVTATIHQREPEEPPQGGAMGQYALPDGSFLLASRPDSQGRPAALQRLILPALHTKGARPAPLR